VNTGVLEEDFSLKWASVFPIFIIPKKNGALRVVTDFRKLNLLLKHCVSPISYSKDWGYEMFNSRVSFATELDLNMGYYHMKIDADSQRLCTIVFPWHVEKYKYKRLSMVIQIS
jgi:hypothetical protein